MLMLSHHPCHAHACMVTIQVSLSHFRSRDVVQILLTNAEKYSKGLLSEILDFVMGTGLIPADGEIWKVRRRYVRAAALGTALKDQ